MEIDCTTFGTITIDGKTYEHDVIIRLSGEVARRKKKLSKKYYGTSHVLSKDEAKFVFENGCEQLILGSGQMGNVHLSPEAEAYFAKKGLHGPVAADPQGDSYVQQLACQEDRPFSRYLLNRVESRCGAVALVSAKTSTTCTSIASGLFVDRSRTSSQAAGIPRT